ncbi:inhibitor of nuclear factor kappa-B kinase subunit epsilon isoform X2 [Amia ocellicauda]|uniref:inhibitor of nuclear factor kappa-B kinase subunit epsilon isoform X2 n=1 Tax=Amia ocellicauda TaxID=2972642 RepID=UPI0034643F0E
MMASTANFLWSPGDILGQGATASVYKARNKKTGELVAVKVFNNMSYIRPYEVQMREFEMLRKLNHFNIVRLFAVEEKHMHAKQKVLVMEYCSGGSLLNLLEDPENAYGLPQSEFLIVLQCVVAGMNHLRENGVVHRDIKPGNIMRLVGEDGRSVYKLTDFGAARELEDDEKFVSIYGTEEYLHPDMYMRAVLRKPQQKTFGVTVDLWSIGVTFYHAAAGCLPFIPFGGPRKNKQIMYNITTQKPQGAIAGVQRVEDGNIEWSYELPVSCQLSVGLKAQLVPVLANILEADQEKCWGFDQFFAETTGILHRVEIHVFSLQQASAHTIYIHNYNTVSIFFEEVAKQTQVTPERQQYLFQGHPFSLEPSMKVVNFPQTTADRPLFLISRELEKTVGVLYHEPEAPTVPSRFDVVVDFSFSKAITGVIHQYLRVARSLMKCQDLVLQGFYCFFENVRQECSTTVQKINILNMKLTACLKTEGRLCKLQSTAAETPDTTDQRKKLQLIQENLHLYTNSVRDFQTSVEHLKVDWSKQSEILAKDKTVPKIECLLEKITLVYQQYRKDRVAGKLMYNDEQIHKFEKINLTSHIKKVKSLFKDECLQKYQAVLCKTADWSSILHEIRSRIKDFRCIFISLIGELQACEEQQGQVLERALLRGPQGAGWAEPQGCGKDRDQMIFRISRLRDEMEAVAHELQRNNSIIESFGVLSASPGV